MHRSSTTSSTQRTVRDGDRLRERAALRRDPRARRVRPPRGLGRRRRHLRGERSVPHPGRRASGPDGFQMADERESLLWGFVNTFDAQVRRLDRSVDRLSPELRDLQTSQDGTEIKSRELELVTDRAQNLGDRRDAFEKLRDAVADRLPHRDRRHLATATRLEHSRRPDTSPRQPSTPATSCAPAKTARPGRTCPRERWSPSQAGSRSPTLQRRHRPPRQGEGEVRGHHPGARRRPRHRAHRGTVGRAERGAPGGVQAGLERSRTGRSVPAQRRAAEPPPQGRHRLPRLRHHRQPGRQGREARHTGACGWPHSPHRLEGPRRFAGVALSFWSSPRAPSRPPSLRASPAAPRYAAATPLFLLHRPRALDESAATTRVPSSRCRIARRQWSFVDAVAEPRRWSMLADGDW